MTATAVLVVDDDQKIVALVGAYLERAGYRVLTAADGRAALRAVEEQQPALVILDVMLPGIDGLMVARRLKAVDGRSTPILMMSARGSVDDRIRGLTEGADDYLAKPFSPAEMVARVDAMLRRSGAERPARTVAIGDLVIDLERHEARIEGRHVPLTTTEFEIVIALARAKGRVLSRDHLVEVLHGVGGAITSRAVDVNIRRLRSKLGDSADRPRYIATVRGAGYRAMQGP